MTEFPPALIHELTRMRRDAARFTVVRMVHHAGCSSKQAFALSHPLCKDAGTWCPEHGWTAFQSQLILPEWEVGARGVK
jgi:hypothetical protein